MSARRTDTDLITIDGSEGEGGGQILRNAISYADILRLELKIFNIRAKRTKPGLRAQHLTGLQLATSICGGSLTGDTISSTEIYFRPNPATVEALRHNNLKDTGNPSFSPVTFRGEIGTAGSICLLLQVALPCALFQPVSCRLLLKGGTNASMAPQYDYWERVLLPAICEQCRIPNDAVTATVHRRGFFPQGGGEVEVNVQPLLKPLQPIHLTERGKVKEIYIRSFHAGKLPRHLAEDMAIAAKDWLIEQLEFPQSIFHTDIVTEKDAVGSGMGILLIATTNTGCRLAGSALSTPKKKAKDVGKEAAEELVQTLNSGGCVDEWLQDQLIIFAALADGESEILTGSLTLHTQTAIWIAKEVAGASIDVRKLDDGPENNDQQTNSSKNTATTTEKTSVTHYGGSGRIPGKHMIRCRGIALLRR